MATYDQSQADDVPLIIDHHLTHNNNNNNNERLHQLASTQILVLSVAVIVCGGIAIVCNAIALTITSNILIVLSAGFYCGAFFVVTGVIGILASKKKTNCLVITLLVMSILSSALFAVVLVVLSLISFHLETVILSICGILAAFLSIRISIFCCRIYCKRSDNGCCDSLCSDTVAFSDGSVPVHLQPPVTSQFRPPFHSSHLPVPTRYRQQQQQDQLQHQQQQLLQQLQQVNGAYNLTKLSHLSPEQLRYLVHLSHTTPWHHTTVSSSSLLPDGAHIPHLPDSLSHTSSQGQGHQPSNQ